MEERNLEEETLRYYAEHAADFAADTLDVSFSAVQNRFLALLPRGGRILDFGCGAGRDTRAFLARGFLVDAVDGSPALAKIASANTEIPVRCLRFQELSAEKRYDGIWACASILHVPMAALPDVLFRMSRAAKPGGILYVSFKYGTFSGLRNGRYFTDLNEAGLSRFLAARPELSLVEEWVSGDARPGRASERWLNALLRKTPSDC
ncbi:MAG: class I SAM-dependent methyltransferase [Lachnospiraceae bacterium]|nr:class I SAM-dependent methyltransferase [Lachnospiraceae bacterium]MCI1398842.1 class I SAM-dependent methyltransferase [Lachnospiraceae bacterium]MCI1424883.1 class I SAM-dependent methyltransferase [Lachnospiraceae bacterium]MCI1453582.1 class I SAM-dependent methyltransferase [Lachnospiraceae bacterium]